MKQSIKDMSEEEINSLLLAVDRFCLTECDALIPTYNIGYTNYETLCINCDNDHQLNNVIQMFKNYNVTYTVDNTYKRGIARVCFPLKELYNLEMVERMQGIGSLFD